MNTRVKRVSVVLALLVVLVIVVPWGVGSLMDREHVGQGEAVIAAPIGEVWETVSDYDRMSEWSTDFELVQRVKDHEGLPRYVVSGDDYSLTFTFVEVKPPTRLVVKLEDEAALYGGEWIYELSEDDGGTRIHITERGWTEPPFFRFALWLFGYDRTIHNYLAALQKKHSA